MLRIFFPIILLLFPLSVIAEWVCPAPAGCKIVQDTGECIGCIEKEEPPIISKDSTTPTFYPRVNESLPKVSSGCTWRCVIEPCSDDMLPDGCRWVGR